MKIDYKLNVWVIVIMAAAATGITVLLLQQASKIKLNSSIRNMEHLPSSRAKFREGREDSYIQALHKMAKVMGDYETIQAEERRDRYDELLKSAMEAEPQLVLLYTVWKPNAIDGMDEMFIGRTGSSPTGQYAMTYSKETGIMIKRASADIEDSMAYITGPNAHKDSIDNPILRKINGNDKYIIRMMVPIINNNNEAVGVLGCLLVIDVIQKVLENTIKTNDEIAVMAIYSGDGTILAHLKPERIGRNMLDVDVEFGDSRREILKAIKNGEVYNGLKYDPLLDDNIRFVVNPIKMYASNFNLAVLIGVSESYVLKETKSITGFAIKMAAIAVFITGTFIFVVLGFISKPILTLTDTLNDISEEQSSITVNRVNGISVKKRENIDQLDRGVSLLKVA
ncbi:MAG: hypothetical protein FWF68_02505 [Spirochaetes bacterium]|nr:hypothetical protein [Spirochaetota bacterium]